MCVITSNSAAARETMQAALQGHVSAAARVPCVAGSEGVQSVQSVSVARLCRGECAARAADGERAGARTGGSVQ